MSTLSASQPSKGRSARRGAAEVHGVTTAAEAASVDRDHRTRVYTIQMSIRMACFIGALFAHGWLQWVLFGAALVLPYFAVVLANNTGPVVQGQMRGVVDPAGPALTAHPAPAPQEETVDGQVVIAGEIVSAPTRLALPPVSGGAREAGRTGQDGDRAA